jgi:hypothetical protein
MYKVTLKNKDGSNITRYFPNPSPMDLELGQDLLPEDPHYGSVLIAEGHFKFGENSIAKWDANDGLCIFNIKAIMGADFT